MKKRWIIYLTICLAACAVPSAGMALFHSDDSMENRRLAEKPVFFTEEAGEKKLNQDYFEGWGLWFDDHFALRSSLVSADAGVQSALFHVSSEDSVIRGKDGWLYYESTLDDYLGSNTISERNAYNIAHNIRLTQQYVSNRGAEFLFTVAPNKNSLYGENMPYYDSKKVDDVNNMTLLTPLFTDGSINYADLFSVFKGQNEVLYLKRDSHWNNKGAVLAYNTLMDALLYDHETYETTPVTREQTDYGDLNRMLYAKAARPEWNYYYPTEDGYSYKNDVKDVSDGWIETTSENGSGKLLMIRDSFGNTLLPFMAGAFSEGYFSNADRYNLERFMEETDPQTVVIEKVERNIKQYATEPPILTAPAAELPKSVKTEDREAELTVMPAAMDADYYQIKGNLQQKGDEPKDVRIRVTAGEQPAVYEAYLISDEAGDDGYLCYLPKESFAKEEALIEVFVGKDDTWEQDGAKKVSLAK